MVTEAEVTEFTNTEAQWMVIMKEEFRTLNFILIFI
jgi:adenine specific DNA methylase Mod